MLEIHNLSQLNLITDTDILALLRLRFEQLGSDMTVFIVEPDDAVDTVEELSDCPILSDVFGDCRYPDPDFSPACEVLEDHGAFYVMLYVFDDDGVEIIIPKRGVDPLLLSMCSQFAATLDVV